MKKLLVAGALVLSVCVMAIFSGYTPNSNNDAGGTLIGVVKFIGDAPKPQLVKPDVDPNVCCDDITLERLLVDKETKGIKNAFIEIEKATPFKWDGKTGYELDQKNCRFAPHILVVPSGAKVDMKNSDAVLHNVKTTSLLNGSFNEGIEPHGKATNQFRFPEKVKIQCSVHSWMTAWIIVTKNGSFALSDEKGNYEIKNIPPGKYKVKIWHEILGTQVKEIEIKANEKTDLNFELKGK